jgi:hypothetical protein
MVSVSPQVVESTRSLLARYGFRKSKFHVDQLQFQISLYLEKEKCGLPHDSAGCTSKGRFMTYVVYLVVAFVPSRCSIHGKCTCCRNR